MTAANPAVAPVSASTSHAVPQVVPKKLAHYVIRAKHWDAMLGWYRQVFHLKTAFEAPVIAFLTYDEEHHRIAFLNTGHLPSPPEKYAGIDHVAFTYGSLADLLHTYQRLKGEGIRPFWCINHGPTTSMYYRDPDGNEIELQVDNYETAEDANGFFSSAAFAANPLGIDFDPDVLTEKLKAGVPEAQLLRQDAAPLPPEKSYVYTTLPPPPPAA